MHKFPVYKDSTFDSLLEEAKEFVEEKGISKKKAKAIAKAALAKMMKG